MININDFITSLKNSGNLVDKNDKQYLNVKGFEPFYIDSTDVKVGEDLVVFFKSENRIFEYWVNQDLLIPPWITHWFQLKDTFLLKLRGNILSEIVEKAIIKAGNLNKVCKALEMSTPSFYHLFHRKIIMISVKKLKKILTFIGGKFVDYNSKIEFTKKGTVVSLKNPKFPINLHCREGAYLLGLIVSDGSLYVDKKARGVVRTKYAAGEQESEQLFREKIGKIYGEMYIQGERIRNCTILKIGSSIVGVTLLKAGAILGEKAQKDGPAPWIINSASNDLKKQYLRAIFDDEGSLYAGPKPGSSYITLSRNRHLLNLNLAQRKELRRIEKSMSERKFPTGHVNKYITIARALELMQDKENMEKTLKIPPRILGEESILLSDLGIQNRLHYNMLSKTSLGRYSISCVMMISRKESMIKFYKEIGFSLKHKKMKLKKIIDMARK